jgi:hypothetical protein
VKGGIGTGGPIVNLANNGNSQWLNIIQWEEWRREKKVPQLEAGKY